MLKEKILFYSIFITFVVMYFTIFSVGTPIILTQTPPPCKKACETCSVTSDCCSYYTSGNYCYYSRSCDSLLGGICDGSGKYCMFNICDIDVCIDGSSTLTIGRTCSASGCSGGTTYTCDSSHCGESRSCAGSTYYCVYDSGWKWKRSKPYGFCCSNSDCSNPKVCSNYRCVCPSGGCEDYQGNCVSSGSFGDQDAPQANERCRYEYCEGGTWHDCVCMCTNNLCPASGAYYNANTQSTQSCADGVCCTGSYSLKCICISCTSDSDCPACSNHVVPKCENGRCKCPTSCTFNGDCENNYCCTREVGAATGECRYKGTIYDNKYLCDPPELFEIVKEKRKTTMLETLINWMLNLLNKLKI